MNDNEPYARRLLPSRTACPINNKTHKLESPPLVVNAFLQVFEAGTLRFFYLASNDLWSHRKI